MYEQKDIYQEAYEQCVKGSLERLASGLGNYEGGKFPERMEPLDFPVLKY